MPSPVIIAADGWPLRSVALKDVDGRMHHIIEKEPILVAIPMDLDTEFPIRLGVRGTCIQADERAVEVRLAYDVVTTDGATTLTIGIADVHWM